MINSSEIIIRAFEHVKDQEYRDSWSLKDLSINIDAKVGEKVNNIRLEVSQMYNHVDFDFSFLEMLSKLLKTKKINVGDRESYSGCETCDHGSSYSCIVRIDNCEDVFIDATSLKHSILGSNDKVMSQFAEVYNRIITEKKEDK
jgi:hypothetical protein